MRRSVVYGEGRPLIHSARRPSSSKIHTIFTDEGRTSVPVRVVEYPPRCCALASAGGRFRMTYLSDVNLATDTPGSLSISIGEG